MEVYDIGMLVVLVGATVFGAWKGMAWQIASLCSLIASYFVALKFRGVLAPMFGDEEPWNGMVAMLVIYCVTSLVIWLAFRVVSGFIDRLKLKEFDRQLGALFGAAKGVLLCVVITFFAVMLSPQARESVLESRSGHYIAVFLEKADGVMPKELHAVVGPYIHKLDKNLDPHGVGTIEHDHDHPTLPGLNTLKDITGGLEGDLNHLHGEVERAEKNGMFNGTREALQDAAGAFDKFRDSRLPADNGNLR